jgi:hypothetical protein
MKALISPQENNRIAQVELQDFEVSLPLYWIECSNEVTTAWTYVEGEFIAPDFNKAI